MKSLLLAALILMPLASTASAQNFISDYSPAVSVARTDKLLLQQGPRTTLYTYTTPAQLFQSMVGADISAALGYAPVNPTGGDVSADVVTVLGGAPVKTSAFFDLTPNPYNYSASLKNDCSTDSTAAFVAGITAAMGSAGGASFRIPKGCWLVSSSAAEIFLLTSPITIYGDGPQSIVQMALSNGNSVDLFHVKPGAYPATENYQFRDFQIAQQSGNHGRSYFNLDTTGSGTFLRNPVFSNLQWFAQPNSGHAIITTYSTGEGVFGLLADHIESVGCLYLDNVGDSITIRDSIIAGSSCGVYLNQLVGAGAFVARGVNNSAANGAYILAAGTAPLIDGGEVEVTTDVPNGSAVDIRSGVTAAQVRNVQIQNVAAAVACTGSISGTTLTTSGCSGGTIYAGYGIKEASGAPTSIAPGTVVVSGSGGTYTVSISQSVSSESVVLAPTLLKVAGTYSTYSGVRFGQPDAVQQPDVILTGVMAIRGSNGYFNQSGAAVSYQTDYDNTGTAMSALLCQGVISALCQVTADSLSVGGPPVGQFSIVGSAPNSFMDVTGQAADQALWEKVISGTTVLYRAVNDAQSGATDWMRVHRGSGYTINDVTLPAPTILGSSLMVGSATTLSLASNEIGMSKAAASGSAPGAAGVKFGVVCGTNAGSAKIIAYGGTSNTPVTVVDNVGSGVTGC